MSPSQPSFGMSRNAPPKAFRDIPKDGCEGDYTDVVVRHFQPLKGNKKLGSSEDQVEGKTYFHSFEHFVSTVSNFGHKLSLEISHTIFFVC